MALRAGLMAFGLVALAACGGGSSGGAEASSPTPVLPSPPVVDPTRFPTLATQSATLIRKYANSAQTAALPTAGTATYRGTVGFNRAGAVEAGTTPSQIGGITLNTDFASGSFDGSISNVVTPEGFPLTGQMTIGKGTIISGLMIAPVESTLGGAAPETGTLLGVFYGPNAEAAQGTIRAAMGNAPTNGFFIAER